MVRETSPPQAAFGSAALRLLDDRGERRRLGNGEGLTAPCGRLQFPGRGQAGDKAAIGQPLLTHRCVDALNPQRAELALAILAVAVGVLHPLVDRGLGGADGVFSPLTEYLGGFQHFLVLGVGGYAPFDA